MATPQFIYSPVCSDFAPSFAIYQGRLFAAWKAAHGKLCYSTFDGGYWEPAKFIYDGRGEVTPTLVNFRGKLWALVKGDGDEDRIYQSSFDGTSWTDWSRTGRGTGGGTSCVPFAGYAYMVYNGVKGEGIWYSKFDGASFPNPEEVKGIVGSPSPPAVSVLPAKDGKGETLVLTWRGKDGDESLWYSTFDGSNWSEHHPIPGASSAFGPALTSFHDHIYAAWRGGGEDQRIWYSRFDGTSWEDAVPSIFTSALNPALVAFQAHLYLGFRGPEGDTKLYFVPASQLEIETPQYYSEQATVDPTSSSEPSTGGASYYQSTYEPPQYIPPSEGVKVRDEKESADDDLYGLRDIGKGLKKGAAKGKQDLAGMFSKIGHRK